MIYKQRNITKFETNSLITIPRKLEATMINVQAFLCLAMVLTQAAGKKGDPLVSVEELRELLKESVQNTISLTALAEQQTQKMEKVCTFRF